MRGKRTVFNKGDEVIMRRMWGKDLWGGERLKGTVCGNPRKGIVNIFTNGIVVEFIANKLIINKPEHG